MYATTHVRHLAGAAIDVWTAVVTLAHYYLHIVPQARRELDHWRRLASLIPDPKLRSHALETLSGESLNAEAAAVFAMLVPREHRCAVTRLTTAYQVMYDYLDTLTEDPPDIEASLLLHSALTDALRSRPRTTDYYELYDADEDRGYLATLVATCSSTFTALPAARVVGPTAILAAQRCAQAQTYTHVASSDERHIQRWAHTFGHAHPQYLWWELASAGISSLAVHALLAAAAVSTTSPSDCSTTDAAYFPSICALSTLFDSLIDAADDRLTGNYSYTNHYRDAAAAAARLAVIVDDAVEATWLLRRRRLHRTILAGVAGFYLSAMAARDADAQPSTRRVISALSPSVIPILWTLRLRRRLK